MIDDKIDEIKNTYLLKSNNLIDMRKELIKNIAVFHPDRNYGSFQDTETENHYKNMNEALQYIDEKLKNETQLIPISSVTEIIKLVQDIIPKNNDLQINKINIYEQKLNTELDARRNDYLSYDKGAKIISSIVALLITTIWIFPSTIENHPILSQYIKTNNIFFTLIWVVGITTTSTIWFFLKIKERKMGELIKKLRNETYQNNLFENFISSKLRNNYYSNEQYPNKKYFSKTEFVNFIIDSHFFKKTRNVFYKKNFIDYELAHEIANIILLRAEEKKIIKKIDIVSLADEYEICLELE
jgi:hypothetical protein